MGFLKLTWLSFINLFFPKQCVVCGVVGSYICVKCFRKNIKVNIVQKCHVCGKEARVGLIHNECRERTYLDGLIYLTVYEGIAKKLIYEAKYNYTFSILDEMSEVMFDYLKLYGFYNNAIFSSIPLHKSKYKLRGFNQAQILAVKLAHLTDRPYRELLTRNRKTKTQVGMTAKERQENLSRAFDFIDDSKKDLILGQRILLIDDVYTTGTTINEAAKILKANGAKEVLAFVFARSRE